MHQHSRQRLSAIRRVFPAGTAALAMILGAAALAVTGLAAPALADVAQAGVALTPAGVATSSPAGTGTASPAPSPDGDGAGLIIFRWGGLELVPVPRTSGTVAPGG